MGETYTSTKEPAAAGFTNGTSYSWIHLWDKLWLHLLVGPAVTGSTNAWDQLSLNPLIGPALQDPLRDQYWHNSLSMLSGPAVVGSNKGTSSGWIYKRDQLARSTKKTRAGWIHKSGQRWLDPLSSDWVTWMISTDEINDTMLFQHFNIVTSAITRLIILCPFSESCLFGWLRSRQCSVLATTTVFLC